VTYVIVSGNKTKEYLRSKFIHLLMENLFVVSFVLFHYVRPLVKKTLDQENFLPGPENLHGAQGILQEVVVGNMLSTVEVNGDLWSCIGEAGHLGHKGDLVRVVQHFGTVLTVRVEK
jgi:membrane protein implicated in regulation of membrane protease activity